MKLPYICTAWCMLILSNSSLVAELVPSPSDPRFGWSRVEPGAHHVGWTSFQDEAGTGLPFDVEPIILDTTPDSMTVGSTGQVRESGTSNALVSGSGNIYSFSSALSFTNTVSAAGLGDGFFTRVVAQVQTWGTEYDPDSMLLHWEGLLAGIAPTFVEELGRINLGPPPQGSGTNDLVDTLVYWDVVGSENAYSISFEALGAHQSLAEFHVDVFSRTRPFTVPEPSGVLMGLTSLAVVARRRRS